MEDLITKLRDVLTKQELALLHQLTDHKKRIDDYEQLKKLGHVNLPYPDYPEFTTEDLTLVDSIKSKIASYNLVAHEPIEWSFGMTLPGVSNHINRVLRGLWPERYN